MSRAIVISTMAVCATAMLFGSVLLETSVLFWAAIVAAIIMLAM